MAGAKNPPGIERRWCHQPGEVLVIPNPREEKSTGSGRAATDLKVVVVVVSHPRPVISVSAKGLLLRRGLCPTQPPVAGNSRENRRSNGISAGFEIEGTPFRFLHEQKQNY